MPGFLLLCRHLEAAFASAAESPFSVNSIANPQVMLRRYQYLPCTRMDEGMSRIVQVAA